MTTGITSFEKFLDEISDEMWVSRCMAYMSSGSLVSVRMMRDDVGEGVRGSRERRFRRRSSSYGMSRMTIVGTLFLLASRMLLILDKQALPEPHMWTALHVSHDDREGIYVSNLTYLR